MRRSLIQILDIVNRPKLSVKALAQYKCDIPVLRLERLPFKSSNSFSLRFRPSESRSRLLPEAMKFEPEKSGPITGWLT